MEEIYYLKGCPFLKKILLSSLKCPMSLFCFCFFAVCFSPSLQNKREYSVFYSYVLFQFIATDNFCNVGEYSEMWPYSFFN